MAGVPILTAGRYFVDVPKDIEGEDLLGFTVYIQMVNHKKYKFDEIHVVGKSMRLFFDVDKLNYTKVTYQDYLDYINGSDSE